MSAFVSGQAQAFDLLLARHRSGLFGFLARQLGDLAAAEDLFQEVFLKVISRRHQFRSEARFAPWLYAIARHACIDHRRRARLRAVDSLDAPLTAAAANQPQDETGAEPYREAGGPNPEAAAQQSELAAVLRRLVAELPEEQREVLLLRTDGELSFPEIAELVGCPLETAKSRMRYALAALRRRLSPAMVPRASGAL